MSPLVPLLLALSGNPGLERATQEERRIARLASDLLAVESDSERDALLRENRAFPTQELCRALLEEAERAHDEKNASREERAYRLTLDLAERVGDGWSVAGARRGLGYLSASRGDGDGALAEFERGLTAARRARLSDRTAELLFDIGYARNERKEYEQAIRAYSESLEAAESSKDAVLTAVVSYNLGGVHRELRDYAKAAALFEKSVALYRELGIRTEVASVLNLLSDLHRKLGAYDRALASSEESLALSESLGDGRGIARALGDRGAALELLGNHAEALESFERSFRLFQSLGESEAAARMLANLAIGHDSQGSRDHAIEIMTQGLSRARSVGSRALEAQILSYLGSLLAQAGEFEKARESLEQALALAPSLASPDVTVDIQLSLARLHERMDDRAEALRWAERAAEGARRMGLKEPLWQSLTTVGRMIGSQGQLGRAFETLAEAILVVERLREVVVGEELTEERFFERRIYPYQAMVWLLMGNGKPLEALLFAELAKARVLLDVLQAGRGDPSSAMTVEERREQLRLDTERESVQTEWYLEQLRSPPDPRRLAEATTRRDELQERTRAFRARLSLSHPDRRRPSVEPRPLGPGGVEELVSDPTTAILYYFVIQGSTYLMVVTRDGESSEVKGYEIAIAQEELAKRIASFREQLARRDLGFRRASRELHDLLLSPAGSVLASRRRLIIVPDAGLWELPFEALLAADGRYLVESATLSYAPSLTVLREMERLGRDRDGDDLRGLLAMGNPISTRARADVPGGVSLAPLPEAEGEVRELAGLYRGDGSAAYVGAEATEARFKSEASRYRVLHLATHAWFDNAHPMASFLVLSPSTAAREDGFLEASEMLGLDLRADLVVLSACDTARGVYAAGEGMIGMSWAIFVAGSPSAVVSRWSVDSESTTTLMVRFHGLLRAAGDEKERWRKAEALRRACLELMEDPRFAHPYYWASFALIGDPS